MPPVPAPFPWRSASILTWGGSPSSRTPSRVSPVSAAGSAAPRASVRPPPPCKRRSRSVRSGTRSASSSRLCALRMSRRRSPRRRASHELALPAAAGRCRRRSARWGQWWLRARFSASSARRALRPSAAGGTAISRCRRCRWGPAACCSQATRASRRGTKHTASRCAGEKKPSSRYWFAAVAQRPSHTLTSCSSAGLAARRCQRRHTSATARCLQAGKHERARHAGHRRHVQALATPCSVHRTCAAWVRPAQRCGLAARRAGRRCQARRRPLGPPVAA